MKRASLNHTYRLVWNETINAFVAVAEFARAGGKSGGKAARLLTTSLALGSLIGGAWASTLPTDGQVVAGSGAISQSGSTLTVTQSSSSLAIDWQSFSIGQGSTVNFVQPSASSVALNRVLGSDVSVIQGALNANGQVFIINPNGVLFSATAQVNVGGLVASTLGISNADFLAGNYSFAGTSSNAIINQGNITAAAGGTIALIAAKITNDGTLTADAGNVLLGAGSKVTLDMGGPVKLEIENDALETLITNGGVIRADGGTIWLTSQAASTLASSVINNTGLIEAQTLATGETGEIVLYAHGGNTTISGTIDASGGYLETSGNTLAISNDSSIKAANWLIDPTNVVIDSGSGTIGAATVGASVIESALGSGNVSIAADVDVTVSSAITWSANKLTLSAGNDININANLTATGTASLAFEYGLASTSGVGYTYTVADGVKIYIPDGSAFTWKKGSTGTTTNLVFDNGLLRFGNGTADSFTADGQLEQPWYFDDVTSGRNGWYKLTYGSYALDIAIAAGGDGTNTWNTNGEVLSTSTSSYSNTYSSALSNKSLEISGYKEGVGTIVASSTVTFTSGQTIGVENAYTLAANANYLKTVTTITNTSASDLSNLRLWVGTRDDYVAASDTNYKTKGNITSDGFEAITSSSEQAKAVEISESNDGVTGAAVLFYSTSADADTVTASCCSFANITSKNPSSSSISVQNDGSYGLFMRLSDLATGASDSMTWYYAAAPVSQISSVVTDVGQSAGVTPTAPTAPTTPTTSVSEQTAIANVQGVIGQITGGSVTGGVSSGSTGAGGDRAVTVASTLGDTRSGLTLASGADTGSVSNAPNLSGGLTFLDVAAVPANTSSASKETAGSGQTGADGGGNLPTTNSGAGGTGTNGFMTVFRVAGGVNYGLPGQTSNEQ